MPSVHLEDLTPFGRLALKLDSEFAELTRSGEQMSKVNLETDNGLDEGIKILTRVSKYGESIAQTMQDFSQALQESREKAEAATGLVAERAQVIQRRRSQENELQEKLTRLKDEVATAGAGLSDFNKPGKGELSDDDKRRIAAELERLKAPMARFVEVGQAIKAEASRGNFKRLERQADSMIDSLQASLRKIDQAIAPK